MNHFEVFFNTHAAHSQGVTAWIGDWGLAPVRYLFNGRDFAILSPDEVHHVASFHIKGKENRSSTSYHMMWSEQKSTGRTVLAIAFLIPGLVLSIFKLISYLFVDIRQKHQAIFDHFSPLKEGSKDKPFQQQGRTNVEIGTVKEPITTIEQLQEELRRAKFLPSGGLVDALIVHADGKLKIVEDPGILAINPLSLILEGAELEHPPSDESRLDDLMGKSHEWEVSLIRTVTKINCPNDGVKTASTVQEALTIVASRKPGAVCACERYRQVIVVPRPTL